jgi:penicillin-binding protein 1C
LADAPNAQAFPTFAEVRVARAASEAWLLDRGGQPLQEIRVDSHARRLAWVPLAEISPTLRAAVLRAEDRRFYEHAGVDWRAIAGALVHALRGARPRGASTLSMQVASLVAEPAGAARGRRGLGQKWRQIRDARELERHWRKDEIFEAYLNLVSFRGELQGIGAASRGLFNKDPHGLDAEESALLAALLRAPNAPAARVARTACAIARGVGEDEARALSSGSGRTSPASAAQRSDAPGRDDRASPVDCAPLQRLARTRIRPHYFIERRADLAPVLGARWAPRLAPGGSVRTTLRADLQRFVAAALSRNLSDLRARRVHDGAVLVVDHASGEVLAYVANGGAQASASQVDGIRARRQAGSVLKPFLYALAFEERLLTPETLLDDNAADFAVGGGVYRPASFDRTFRGLVPAKVALASSLNVPAVRVLLMTGVDPLLERLQRAGFTGLREAEHYGPSLALGTADITLWELVTAYATLARGGERPTLRWMGGEGDAAAQAVPDVGAGGRRSNGPAAKAAGDAKGKQLSLAIPAGPSVGSGVDVGDESRRAYQPATTALIARVLSDRESRALVFGLDNPLATRFWAAAKTGTSKDMRDNWCVGFTDRYTIGVWMGNFDGQPMQDVSGITGAAPLWARVADYLHAQSPSRAPTLPEGVTERRGPRGLELYLSGTEPPERGLRGRSPRPVARITYPAADTLFALDPEIPVDRQAVLFEAEGLRRGDRWRLNGKNLSGRGAAAPWRPRPGQHVLELVDAQGHALDHVRFEVRGNVGRSRALAR